MLLTTRTHPTATSSRASSAKAGNPVARVVLIGASNLTRGISTAIETARLVAGGAVEFHVAMGHGRSYGRPSRVMLRTLPGVVECGLWRSLEEALDKRNDLSTYALLTDIGNDIVYGHGAAAIMVWLDQCIGRLQQIDAHIALTQLPLASLNRIGPRAYRLVQSLIFRCKGPAYEDAMAQCLRVNEHIIALASDCGTTAIPHRPEWYRLDPVHQRRRLHPQVWREFMGGWPLAASRATEAHARVRGVRPSLRRWLTARWSAPLEMNVAGMTLTQPQPVARLSDGSTLAFF